MKMRDLIKTHHKTNRNPSMLSKAFETSFTELDGIIDEFWEDFSTPSCYSTFLKSVKSSPRVCTNELFPIHSFEKGGNFVVRVDIPGMLPENVELSVEENQLKIVGERKDVVTDSKSYYREVSYGKFERRLCLPEHVDVDSINALYSNGVLEVTMKISPPPSPTVSVKKIQINNG